MCTDLSKREEKDESESGLKARDQRTRGIASPNSNNAISSFYQTNT